MMTHTRMQPLYCCFLLFFLCSCVKETSHYYPDKETPGSAIFSNQGNNVLSCFIDGSAWQTISRSSGGSLFARPVYEVYFERQHTAGVLDTLSIIWEGHYNNDQNGHGFIELVLPVAKNFKLSDLSFMQGKRLVLDSSNGFFTINVQGLSGTNSLHGKGTVYFNQARFDSVSTGYYYGRMAGLLQIDFGTFKITEGRFDHNAGTAQYREFY